MSVPARELVTEQEDNGSASISENDDFGWRFAVTRSVYDNAGKFWGLEKGISLAPIPQDPEYKLRYLRNALLLVPNLDTHVARWAQNKRDKTIVGIAKFLEAEIDLTEIPIENDTRSMKASEVFHHPDIHTRVADYLRGRNDPVTFVVDQMLEWRQSNAEYIDPRSFHVGQLTITYFRFGAGGAPFTSVVEDQARGYFLEMQGVTQITDAPSAR